MARITNLRAARIGEASRRTGIHIETIRYYERVGVVAPPARGEGGQRIYGDADIRRLSFVRRARELGFTLEEVRHLLALADGGSLTCEEVYRITSDHLATVRARIADLERMAEVLQAMAGECRRGEVPECPIIDALFDDR